MADQDDVKTMSLDEWQTSLTDDMLSWENDRPDDVKSVSWDEWYTRLTDEMLSWENGTPG